MMSGVVDSKPGAEDPVSRTLKTVVAGGFMLLAVSASFIAAVISLVLWFYGAWSAVVELIVLGACAMLTAGSIVLLVDWAKNR